MTAVSKKLRTKCQDKLSDLFLFDFSFKIEIMEIRAFIILKDCMIILYISYYTFCDSENRYAKGLNETVLNSKEEN